MKRRLKDVFKHFDRHALDLVERMLNLDPAQRITAKDALDADYFWNEPLPCLPSSLPKYEASHEFQTKKKRQQQKQQQEELAKRQKTQHPQPSSRLPPLQQPAQGHMPLRPGPNQPVHNPAPVPSGPSHHYANQRTAGGPQNRYPQAGRPPHGGAGGGYNQSRGGQGGGYGSAQGGGYGAPSVGGQVVRGTGHVSGNSGYAQGGSYSGVGGGRGPNLTGTVRGQQYGVPNPHGMSQPPGTYGGQPYMSQQYVDADGAYSRATASHNYQLAPNSPSHRQDYRQH